MKRSPSWNPRMWSRYRPATHEGFLIDVDLGEYRLKEIRFLQSQNESSSVCSDKIPVSNPRDELLPAVGEYDWKRRCMIRKV
jgi:hypothetical protein